MPLGIEGAAPLVHLSTDFIRAKEYLEAIVTSTSDAICTTDVKGKIIYFSPGAERMLGVPSDKAVGRQAHAFYPGGIDEARELMRLLRRDGTIENREMVLSGGEGRPIHVSMSASLLRDRTGTVIGTLAISKDISRRVELERKLRELSITDNLTGLFNQRHLRERLTEEVRRARRQRYRLSLVLMDLDGFKAVNDLHGHQEGDRILRAFADAIQESIRAGVDCAFRCGGDEFIILFPGLDGPRAARVARRIASAAAAQGASRGQIHFSFGVATLSGSLSSGELLRLADRRMFRMKGSRRKTRPAAAASPSPGAHPARWV